MPSEILYESPPLYEKQRAAIFAPERYSIIEASTKSGKTYGCMAWLFELAASAAGRYRNYWWVAPIRQQAKIVFLRFRHQLPREVAEFNDTDLAITLKHNRSVITFKGSDNPDSLFAEDVYGAVVDEATRCKEQTFHALRTTLTATGGPLRIIGNVKGRKNWAYKLARRAEAGESDMHYARITAADAIAAGVLSQEEIADARSKLPGHVFRELYEAQPSDDGGNPFGIDAIHDCIAELSTAEPTCFGVDLAKSTDWSVIIGLDRSGAVCRFERFQAPWQMTKPRIAAAIGSAPALIDSSGVGDPIVEELQGTLRNVEGFKFTSSSKQQLMEGLASSIAQRHVRFPDGPIVSELEAFEYQYTRSGVVYGSPEGMHDDCVMALALAIRQYRFGANRESGILLTGKPYKPKPEDALSVLFRTR